MVQFSREYPDFAISQQVVGQFHVDEVRYERTEPFNVLFLLKKLD